LSNRCFVALERSLRWTLAREAKRSEQVPDMAGAVLHAKAPRDELGHPRQCPQLGRKAIGHGTLHQRFYELAPLALVQVGGSAQAFAPERCLAVGLELGGPPRNRLAAHFQPTRYLGLRQALLQQLDRLESALLERFEIPSVLHAFP
jgi:hypothetical protein